MKYYFVSQNKSFYEERQGGYLWAPQDNVHHHKRILDVNNGDIIVHNYNKRIVAISIAEGNCYDYMQPIELQKKKSWENKGWSLKCTYYDIKNPIIISDYKNEILDLQPNKYAPFDKNGKCNQGYLFEINKELFEFILDKLVVNNLEFVNNLKAIIH